jgi:uncharacterized protein involved in outer membrane biogenesis
VKRKILIAVAVLLLLAIVGGVLLVQFLDLNRIVQIAAQEVEKSTGRQLTVGGSPHLIPALTPTVVLEDLRFQNAAWGSQPEMARCGRLEITLALLPLLQGEIGIRHLALKDVMLLLERNPDGAANWQFKQARSAPTPLVLPDRVEIDNLQVIWHDGATQTTREVRLKTLESHRDSVFSAAYQVAIAGEFRERPLQLTTHLDLPSDKTDPIRLTDIQGRFGETDLAGDLAITLGENGTAALQGDLRSQRLDLATPPAGNEQRRRSGKVFSREPLPIPPLSGLLQGEIRYHAQEVTGLRLPLRDLSTSIKLQQDLLTMQPIRATLAGAPADGLLRLRNRSGVPHLEFELSGKQLDLGELFRSLMGTDALSGKGDLSLKLQGSGSSVAEIMAGLDGHSRLLAGSGRIRAGALDTVTGGLRNIFGTLLSSGSNSAVMNCMASDFEIRKGIATSRAFLVDSEYSTLFGQGNINLASERIAFQLSPKPKSVTLNVAVPVKIGGTLAHPDYTLEKMEAARKALGVIGLFAFPPAALIGLGELGTGEPNPCLDIARGGTQETQESKNPVARGADAVKESVEGIGRGIKGLFGE